ncbi:MAG: hypothetical protein V1763_02140 [Parcubacteria group bacterium]
MKMPGAPAENLAEDQAVVANLERDYGQKKAETLLLNAAQTLETFAVSIKDDDPRRQKAIEIAETIRRELLI